MTDDLPRSPQAVREVYDEIASHFSKTRAYPWPEVADFLERVDEIGGQGLDVGCGNGRHVAPLGAAVDRVVGLDLSRSLLGQARARIATEFQGAELVQGDAASLPIRDDTIAVCLSIATIHHLPDRAARVESLREIERVLASDGLALVSGWSTAHERFDAPTDAAEGFDTTVDWTLPGGETRPRFYHIYSPTEFETDLERADLSIVASYVSSGNCYAEVSA